MAHIYSLGMSDDSYSLGDLANLTGLEERTIRSYIERGLLPGAQARGRAATYSNEHLSRLRVILNLKRARPNIGLSEIRIFLQGLSPEQIDRLASGEITAASRVFDRATRSDAAESEHAVDDETDIPRTVNWERPPASLTGVERLVCLLREVSGFTPIPTSKVEGWHRITVTPDVELSVRAGFDEALMAAFRELADLLRNLLQRTEVLSTEGNE